MIDYQISLTKCHKHEFKHESTSLKPKSGKKIIMIKELDGNTFQIGDQVLYFNVTLDHSHSGKFNPKWKGPFIIQRILPNGAYTLATNEGQLLRTPINGNLLKLYHEPLLQFQL